MPDLYRPSCGTEGADFEDAFCCRCVEYALMYHGTMDCRLGLLTASFCFDVDDPEYPQEWTYDASGHPTCTAFKEEPR